MYGGLAVWRLGGWAIGRLGDALAVWRFGGLAVWRFGGLAVGREKVGLDVGLDVGRDDVLGNELVEKMWSRRVEELLWRWGGGG